MARVLVVFEDQFFKPLKSAVWRLCERIGTNLTHDLVYWDCAKGDGGFKPYLQDDWPIAAAKGIPKFGKPDHVVCVFDLDRAEKFFSKKPPTAPKNTDVWAKAACERFAELATGWKASTPGSLYCFGIRWNIESLLLACFDRLATESVIQMLSKGSTTTIEAEQRLTQFLTTKCKVAAKRTDPNSVADMEFTHCWRKPNDCLANLLDALKVGQLSKADTRRTDLIQLCTQGDDVQKLASRVPDLNEIASTIARLTAS